MGILTLYLVTTFSSTPDSSTVVVIVEVTEVQVLLSQSDSVVGWFNVWVW